ncbi:hypothetical protein P4233_31220 [Pseudomonas aeruginosa]|nr:hypothetical protein [Pseudomonas aeruginosa]
MAKPRVNHGVMDALRDAVSRGGMFAIFYVDNDSGLSPTTPCAKSSTASAAP